MNNPSKTMLQIRDFILDQLDIAYKIADWIESIIDIKNRKGSWLKHPKSVHLKRGPTNRLRQRTTSQESKESTESVGNDFSGNARPNLSARAKASTICKPINLWFAGKSLRKWWVGFPGFGEWWDSPWEIGNKTYGELRIFNLLGGVSWNLPEL